jgi:pantothenate kinase-related protein Tda10
MTGPDPQPDLLQVAHGQINAARARARARAGEGVPVMGVAGPQGSGKSTLVAALAAAPGQRVA